jgi:hypothetical protein
MKTLNMSCFETFEMVKSKRKKVFPNLAFMKQLKDYEKILSKQKEENKD